MCAVFFFSFFFVSFENIYMLFSQTFLCAYNLDKHQTVYTTYGSNELVYAQICLQIHIYLYL
jgi:hypothetical protein